MKKIRYLPFGYWVQDGAVEIHPEESALIHELYQNYLAGSSIKKLTEYANQSGIAYRENASAWNKNMITRILEDERYWNGERFPVLIEKEFAKKAIQLKKSKTSEPSELAFLKRKMTCICGNRFTREHRGHNQVIWHCKGCTAQMGPFRDSELLHVIAAKLDWISRHIEQIEPKARVPQSLSVQTVRMNNEINQMMDQKQVDSNRVLALILDCASEKYRQCQAAQCDHLTIKIKEIFQRQSESKMPTKELVGQTVENVILQPDGMIQLRLKNGKIL